MGRSVSSSNPGNDPVDRTVLLNRRKFLLCQLTSRKGYYNAVPRRVPQITNRVIISQISVECCECFHWFGRGISGSHANGAVPHIGCGFTINFGVYYSAALRELTKMDRGWLAQQQS